MSEPFYCAESFGKDGACERQCRYCVGPGEAADPVGNTADLPELDEYAMVPEKPQAHESEGYTSSNRTYRWQWIYESDFDEYAAEFKKVLDCRERQLRTLQAELITVRGERDLAQHEWRTLVARDTAMIESLRAERDAAIAKLGETREALKVIRFGVDPKNRSSIPAYTPMRLFLGKRDIYNDDLSDERVIVAVIDAVLKLN